MIAAAENDTKSIQELSEKLKTELNQIVYQLPEWQFWPECSATFWLTRQPNGNNAARDLIQIQSQSTRKYANDNWFKNRVTPLQRFIELQSGASKAVASRLQQWKPGSLLTAEGRGMGKTPSSWIVKPGSVEQFPAETVAPLFFQSPLEGNFELSAEVSIPQRKSGLIGYAMSGITPNHDRKGARLLSIAQGENKLNNEFPVGSDEGFATVQLVVKDKMARWLINGVEMTTQPLPTSPDPWLVLRGRASDDQCTLRNVRILGNPTIPDSIDLSAVSNLVNWRPDEFADRLGNENQEYYHWFQNSNEIGARIRTDRTGNQQPSSLILVRPLTFDGELTYEFFYKPGSIEVHPTLGRTCWKIQSDGIVRQKVNAAQWEDFNELAQLRAAEDSPIRIGKTSSLKSNEWNNVKLAWTGDDLVISINGEEALRDKLDQYQPRLFGFFRYSDINESKIRNVILKGNWPKSLPTIAEQELAHPAVNTAGK